MGNLLGVHLWDYTHCQNIVHDFKRKQIVSCSEHLCTSSTQIEAQCAPLEEQKGTLCCPWQNRLKKLCVPRFHG